MMTVAVLKQHMNLNGGLLSAWVVVGSVLLVRGIRRDRQSSTAAATERLLKEASEDKKENEPKIKRPQSSFFRRLLTILKIVCPGLYTKESWFLLFLSALLIGILTFLK